MVWPRERESATDLGSFLPQNVIIKENMAGE